jgi:hypothetical protein
VAKGADCKSEGFCWWQHPHSEIGAEIDLLLVNRLAADSEWRAACHFGDRKVPPMATKPLMLSRLVALPLLMAVAPALADTIPTCNRPEGVLSATLQTAPPRLVQALKEKIGELVPPGAAFDATDVIVTGRNRRLIFVWNAGKRWIVATEHGGRGYHDPIFAYDLDPNAGHATLVREEVAYPETVCSIAIGLLKLAVSTP